MNEIAELALDAAVGGGATYADVRVVQDRREEIVTRNGRVASLAQQESLGVGVRVIVDEAWGFAASDDLSNEAIKATALRAVAIARASALYRRGPMPLAPAEKVVDVWAPPFVKDPFQLPLEYRIAHLLAADRIGASIKGVTLFEGFLECSRQSKLFLSSIGSRIHQDRIRTGAGIAASAFRNGELQRRSWPASSGGQFLLRGWEMVEALDLPGHAARIGEEAVALLDAPECPSQVGDLILEGSQLALQIHESIGHPIELDRVLGSEANFAGTSFLTIPDLGTLRYGSPAMNVVVDARLEHGPAPGTMGYDDEGVAPQRTEVVTEGIFTGFLTSRETAPAIGQARSNGSMRAVGWNFAPLVRITNLSLLPGEGSLESLIGDTRDGVLMSTIRSWSIDDKRVNFQFGPEIAWEIKGGKRGRMLKNPSYGGNTLEFWNSLDRVCGPEEWLLWGMPDCGKGQPYQMCEVGHGTAPARFRDVRIGVEA